MLASLNNITHAFDSRVILRGLSLEISPRQRVALVGANGSGKTTLFRILARELKPTEGNIFWKKRLRVAYLPQQPRMDTDETLFGVACRPFAPLIGMESRMRALSAEMARAQGERLGGLMKEYSRLEAAHEAAGGFAWEHQVHKVLAGVGLAPGECDYQKPCRVLSGGQQCRLALAAVLLSDSELLLLDEPTNHLDLDGVQWLEGYLDPARLPAAVILISHDRYLLDRLAEKVYELDGGRVESYPGNYGNYVRERDVRRLHHQRQSEADREYIARQRDFVARFHVGSRAKEARGRARRLERRLKAGEFVTEGPKTRRTLSLRLAGASLPTDPVALRMEGLSKSFGPEPIARELSLELKAGQKLGVLGPNGGGKTTLLRMILGEVHPDAGTIELGRAMTVGYYDQTQCGLDDSLSVLEQMRAFVGTAPSGGDPAGGDPAGSDPAGSDPAGSDGALRTFLAQFLFTGKDVFKRVGALSGGERSRLLLARLLYDAPNFLLLDEPTNHLDIPSREVLEEALKTYDGTVILVSHDRYLVDRVCGRLLVGGRGQWRLIETNYSTWRAEEDRRQAAQAAQAAQRKSAKAASPAARGERAAKSVTVGGLNSYQLARITLAEVEDQIHAAEGRLAEVEAALADPKLYADAEAWQTAERQYNRLREEIERLMQVWQHKMDA